MFFDGSAQLIEQIQMMGLMMGADLRLDGYEAQRPTSISRDS
jgi:hypothetical protein